MFSWSLGKISTYVESKNEAKLQLLENELMSIEYGDMTMCHYLKNLNLYVVKIEKMNFERVMKEFHMC